MLANKWFQFALGSPAWIVWLALFISVRFCKRDAREWKAPAIWAAIGAFAVVMWCWIAEQKEIENIFQLNFYGMLFAALWLRRRYPEVTAPFTTLNL